MSNEKLKITVNDENLTQIYVDGVLVKGAVEISFNAKVGETATHTITYLSSKAGK